MWRFPGKHKSVSGSPEYDLFAALVMLTFLFYSIDVRTVDIGGCDISFRGGATNPSVRISLSRIYIRTTGRYKRRIL